jgi:cell division protein FtsW (lipid II flippase)
MKKYLKLKSSSKKHKPSAINNYKVAYLDKKSKTYHRIVMTAYTALFGVSGLMFVFASNASSEVNVDTTSTTNLQLVFVILSLIFIVLMSVLIFIKNQK